MPSVPVAQAQRQEGATPRAPRATMAPGPLPAKGPLYDAAACFIAGAAHRGMAIVVRALTAGFGRGTRPPASPAPTLRGWHPATSAAATAGPRPPSAVLIAPTPGSCRPRRPDGPARAGEGAAALPVTEGGAARAAGAPESGRRRAVGPLAAPPTQKPPGAAAPTAASLPKRTPGESSHRKGKILYSTGDDGR